MFYPLDYNIMGLDHAGVIYQNHQKVAADDPVSLPSCFASSITSRSLIPNWYIFS
jgi:hypothetical protein